MTPASPGPGSAAELNAALALADREHRAGRLSEAAAAYRRILAVRPDIAEVHGNLGVILAQQGRLDLAREQFEQALALRPGYSEAHYNLGNVLWNQGQLEPAAARFEQAIALRPDYAEAHNLLGNVLKNQGKLSEAIARYRQALVLKPDYAEAEMNLAVCCLAEGDFERGWPLHEARTRLPGYGPLPNLPRWRGEPLAGRRLVLLAEQGFGDTLQFLRFGRLFKARGAHVVLAAQAALGPLLATCSEFDELYLLGSGQPQPACDFYLPLMSTAGALGASASTIPGEVPYLSADPGLTEHWRQALSAVEGFKIGVCWQGARDYVGDCWRSAGLRHLAALAGLPGVGLVSLQKGFGSEQIATVDFPILDLSERLDESAGRFMDTAALIQNLDLVVTVDTAIAHLAGALGAPVWVALQRVADWRWLRDRDDSPWYPTMRLFRQTTLGDWPEVFQCMARAIQQCRDETA